MRPNALKRNEPKAVLLQLGAMNRAPTGEIRNLTDECGDEKPRQVGHCCPI
jgi:hypothetical protein